MKSDLSSHKPCLHAGHRERLRARFLQGGLSALLDYELLELLLAYVLPRRDVKPIAKALLLEFKTVGGVLDAEPGELARIKGIKERSATFFRLIRDTARATLRERVRAAESVLIRNSREVREFLIREIGHDPRESFYVIFLDNQNRLLGCETVQTGTINQTAVYPREIFERALRYRAAALIFAHNHPSGVLKPSAEDVRLNQKLTEAARLLQLSVLDHVIVSREGHYSFHESGIL
jgi:DNA repair protein RadC